MRAHLQTAACYVLNKTSVVTEVLLLDDEYLQERGDTHDP